MKADGVFIKMLGVASQLASREISDGVLAVYCDTVAPDFEKAALTLKGMLAEIRPGKFPSANDILERMGRTTAVPDDDLVARDISGKIIRAITKIGWANPKEAKAYIGDLGWQVVELQGGWHIVCDVTNDQLPTMQAQWRELAKAQIMKARCGGEFKLPGHEKSSHLISELAASLVRK